MNRIRVLDDAEAIKAQVARCRADPDAEPFLCTTGGSILAFCACVFPGLDERRIYVQKFRRSPLGRGLHFDVFGNVVSWSTPWIGVFNLSGRCHVRMFALPQHLAREYFQRHPTSSERAYHARREISKAALEGLTESPAVGILEPRSGLVIPQRHDGFQWVHEVVPADPGKPGEFIKFVAQDSDLPLLTENGYVRLAVWIEQGPPAAPDRIDAGVGGGVPVTQRHCNLD